MLRHDPFSGIGFIIVRRRFVLKSDTYIAEIQNIHQDNARTSQGDVRAPNKFKLQITFK